MYNLIWRSVTCRPGNGGLLSGVKRPIIAQTIATARRCDPIKDHTVARVVPPIGLHPHSGTTRATLSHPDCRSALTLIVAGHEMIADKGYHSREGLKALEDSAWKSRISE